jgi:hypothetical protein
LVEVTPIDGQLDVGDWVVVGREGSTRSSDDTDTDTSQETGDPEETDETDPSPDTTDSSAG